MTDLQSRVGATDEGEISPTFVSVRHSHTAHEFCERKTGFSAVASRFVTFLNFGPIAIERRPGASIQITPQGLAALRKRPRWPSSHP